MKGLVLALAVFAITRPLQAQDPKDPSQPFAHYIVPFESGLRETDRTPELWYRIWSIRDARWYEFRSGEGYFLPENAYADMFKGDPILKEGMEGEFQIAFASPYHGKHQFIFEQDPGKTQPVEKETIFMEDDVELAWELRASPGIEILSYPMPPNHSVRWKEPVVAPFQIRIKSLKEGQALCLYLYINAYRDGKLVGYSGHVFGVNPSGFDKCPVGSAGWNAWVQYHGKWAEADLVRERHRASEVSRMRPLKKGQFLSETRNVKAPSN